MARRRSRALSSAASSSSSFLERYEVSWRLRGKWLAKRRRAAVSPSPNSDVPLRGSEQDWKLSRKKADRESGRMRGMVVTIQFRLGVP